MSDDEVAARANLRIAAELEAFRYAVSHDLRFPLRVIDGFSRALEEDYAPKLDDDGRQYLGSIRKGVARLEAMVGRLDELLRLASSVPVLVDVDVSALAAAVAEQVRPRYAHAVTVEIAPGLVVRADRRLLELALAALIDNAFKFTARADAPVISLEREGAALVVRDNGTGFDATADRLFAPFRRLCSNDDPGDGIGLAIVHRVAALHAGAVRAVSQPGSGAALYLSL